MTEKETKEAEGIALLKHYAANSTGRAILTKFGESIRVANAFQRTQWVPTVRKSKGWTVNLRTGQIFALTLKRDEVQILLLPEMLRDADRKALEETSRGKYEPEHPPGSARYTLDLAAARKLWGSVEQAHHTALQQNRHSSGAKNNPEAHAVVDYLRRELELDLPYPDQELVGGNGKPDRTPAALLEKYAVSDAGREILRAFSKSIEVANAASPGNWGTTLNDRSAYVALNIRNACAIRLHPDRVRILLFPDRLDAMTREALEEKASHSWDRSAIQGSHNYELDWSSAADMWESLERAHHAALTADPWRRTPFYKSHSNAVVDFLNRTLDLELAHPDYGTDPDGKVFSRSSSASTDGSDGDEPEFLAILRSLETKGLHFPAETVANYLLALQTKRFAILTGISGTGKTQIAREVARYWGPSKSSSAIPVLQRILKSVRREEDKDLSLIVGAKDEVLGKYQPLFSDGHISKLTAEEFKGFLRYENNKHWTGIARSGGKLTADMDALRSTLRILFDESIPLRARLESVRPASGTPPVGGLGKATLTPLLLIRYPDRYGVLNRVAEKALKALDLWPDVDPSASFADRYIAVNARLLELANVLGVDLWTLDALWWRVRDRTTPSDGRPSEPKRRRSHYELVPVRPDWVDNRGLLGYFNPLSNEYSTTPFLSLLLEAQAEEQRAKKEGRDPHPFFVVLDEMNLARVEHYFSDFLSALESDEAIPLHVSEEVEEGGTESGTVVPRQLHVPKNVFFTGTVNVDETTYMFSPKVLDRAFTIEFDRVDLRGYTGGSGSDQAEGLELDGSARVLGEPYKKPDRKDWLTFVKRGDGLHETLLELHGILEGEHRHFGYRVANEIARFVNLACEHSSDPRAAEHAFDLALLQKVLPKFHGTQQELEPILRRLFRFAVRGRDVAQGDGEDFKLDNWEVENGRLVSASDPPAPEGGDVNHPTYPRTAAKIWRMLRRLNQRGFTSFIE